ncbi:MAG: flavin reductase [Clostridia bacterium]|nr:flavin reductase [Clostridia bacterium]
MDTKALQNITYGLYLLSAEENGKDNACIINTVVQVANNPARISISVAKGSLTHDMIKNTGKFTVSAITQDAKFDLFKHFGLQSGRDTDKFAGRGDVARAENGLYYLTSCANAYISAWVSEVVDLGSHTLFIADVTQTKVLSDAPACTYSYYHSNIKELPKATAKKGFRCVICGYVYEGETLPEDFICPLCKHGASDFEPIE